MTEAQFVVKLAKNYRYDGFLTKREVDVGYGIADLVVIDGRDVNRGHCQVREGYGQSSQLLGEDYFKVLSQLPETTRGRKVQLDDIINKTNISRPALKYKVLKSLQRKRFISKFDERYYCKINGWLPLAKEVTAIEAKMKDWRSGIFQAIRYKAFADRVYLAIPDNVERLVDYDVLRKFQVGLITFDAKTNTRKVVFPAKRARPQNLEKKNFAVEYFWRRNELREATAG